MVISHCSLLPDVHAYTQRKPISQPPPSRVFEVIWGHRQWTTAIALPKWVNNYHCLGLLAQACGPILTSRKESCAMSCDNTRLSEELIECHIGSFVQVHIRTHCSDLVRIDLQAALQRSIQTLHLPVHQLPDELVKMKVFVPQGVTCFSSETFDSTSPFEYWQKALMDQGRRVYPLVTTSSSPLPLLSDLASQFDDSADPVQCEPWRLISLDTSRGRSRNRELHHSCCILVDFRAFRSFGFRPHGVIEIVLGQDEFSFPTVLPSAVNVVCLGEFLAPLMPTGLPGLQWQA